MHSFTVKDISLLIIGVDIPGISQIDFKFLSEKGVIVVILKANVAVIPVPEYFTYTELSIIVPSYKLQLEKEH
jgi:hypothetical protein